MDIESSAMYDWGEGGGVQPTMGIRHQPYIYIYRGKGCISELSVEDHQPYMEGGGGRVVEDKVGDIS